MNPCGDGCRQRMNLQEKMSAATIVPSRSHGDCPVALMTTALTNRSAHQVKDPHMTASSWSTRFLERGCPKETAAVRDYKMGTSGKAEDVWQTRGHIQVIS